MHQRTRPTDALCPYLVRALLRPVKEASVEILRAGILAAVILICSGIAATIISLLKPYFDHGLQIIAPLAAIGSALNGKSTPCFVPSSPKTYDQDPEMTDTQKKREPRYRVFKGKGSLTRFRPLAVPLSVRQKQTSPFPTMNEHAG